MTRPALIVPILTMFVLLADASLRPSAASDLLDFFRLRDAILEETESGRAGRGVVDSSAILGTWARWRGSVVRVLEPQEGLWLILVEMDPPDAQSPSHDLEVWADDPAAARLSPGQDITVKGTIVDYRRLPGAVVHIVIDARS
jgi:hypothetical protein